MKTLFTLPLLTLCCLFLNAQNQQSFSNSSLPPSKKDYIANAAYIYGAQSSFMFTGDSLLGFDEMSLKNMLLSKGLGTTELLGHIANMKRRFITQKYYPSTFQTNNPASTGKPIGALSTINTTPCINEGFESTLPGNYTAGSAVSGWTVLSRVADSQCSPTNWNSGSTAFAIVSTPIMSFPYVGNVPQSPLGGSNVARLNNFTSGDYDMTRMSQTFPVTSSNNLFQFAFAGYWEDGGTGHQCCDQPYFKVLVTPCGSTVSSLCSSIDLGFLPGCGNAVPTLTATSNIFWTNWQTRMIDLTPYIGSCVTIDVIAADCSFGGHHGVTLFDAICGSQQIGTGIPGFTVNPGASGVSYCAGSGYATLQAPAGYVSYSWTAPYPHPPLSSSQATLPILTTTNAISNSVFTVNLLNGNGCVFISTMALVPTTVNIAAIGSASSCVMGSSGSATIIGNGSGSGYNYLWLNSSGTPISTLSTVSGLPPGIYTASISAIGNATCGSAISNVTIGVKAPTISTIVTSYCPQQPAYLLSPTTGTNYQWYNNLSPISGSLGGTTSSYTVSSPTTSLVYRLSYVSSQGCKDSIVYLLSPIQGGGFGAINSAIACQNSTNGSITLSLTPGTGSPGGFNVFSIVNSNSTTPTYSAGINNSSLLSFTATGLSAGGSYDATAFDGSCYYSFNFSVSSYTTNYTLNAASSTTLCPSNFTNITVSLPGPSIAYTYSWSPNLYLPAGNTSTEIVVFCPSGLAAGTNSTVTYSIIVTPTNINCPETKTFNVTFGNPIPPSFVYIPALCENGPVYTATVFPATSIFSNNAAISPNGLITPSLASLGLNSYVCSNSIGTCVAQSTGTFMVNPSPTLQISGNTTVCKGQSTTLLAQGAGVYSWNGTAPNPVYSGTPTMDTTYYVTGGNSFGCYSTVYVPIHVTPLPVLVITGDTSICIGESSVLYASGADSYNWIGIANSSTASVSPTINTTYTVIGINNPGSCTSSAVITVEVIDCTDTGLEELLSQNGIRVFPNPSSGTLFIEASEINELILSDLSGKIIFTKKLEPGSHSLDLSSLADGYYLLNVRNDKASNTYKLLKNN
ncbi:MAG: T9SS type A sorting domain-containing protein [Bacteroidia bacterium]|nr:T9SS type A sorting domain-containing protein [Bacteroidia bacterium]